MQRISAEQMLKEIGGPVQSRRQEECNVRFRDYFFKVRMYFTRSLIWASVNLPL